jgi:hypothetical protein
LFEPYRSVNQGKQRMVPTYSDVAARFYHRAALPHEDRAGLHDRAVAALDAEPLALAIATVA